MSRARCDHAADGVRSLFSLSRMFASGIPFHLSRIVLLCYQPRVEGALPMEYVHTDLTLLGEADYLIFTFSSNFGALVCGGGGGEEHTLNPAPQTLHPKHILSSPSAPTSVRFWGQGFGVSSGVRVEV